MDENDDEQDAGWREVRRLDNNARAALELIGEKTSADGCLDPVFAVGMMAAGFQVEAGKAKAALAEGVRLAAAYRDAVPGGVAEAQAASEMCRWATACEAAAKGGAG